MGIEYILFCDMCSQLIGGSTRSVREVKRRAKAEGTYFRYEGQDLCHECYEKNVSRGNQLPTEPESTADD
jgi:hypothetical protein